MVESSQILTRPDPGRHLTAPGHRLQDTQTKDYGIITPIAVGNKNHVDFEVDSAKTFAPSLSTFVLKLFEWFP